MVALSRDSFSYLPYGKKSCLLDTYQGNVKDVFEIPRTVDGYTVTGFTSRFVKSIKAVRILVLPDSISNLSFTSDNYIDVLNYVSWSSIEVSSSNTKYTSVDGVLFSKNLEQLVLYPPAKEDVEYRIPDAVLSLAGNAFCHNANLSTLFFGEKFKCIKEFTISLCYHLKHVMISGVDTMIQGDPFGSCRVLQDITFVNGSNNYEVQKGGVYRKHSDGRLELLFFPNALSLSSSHYVVPKNTVSISESAMIYFKHFDKVHIPSGCRLPDISLNQSIKFYGMVPIQETRSPIEEPQNNNHAVKEQVNSRRTLLERLFDMYKKGPCLDIPEYKDYLNLEAAIRYSVSSTDMKLMEEITSIQLPLDMENVDADFFKYFTNLEVIKCDSEGIVQVINSVVYKRDDVIFFPPCSRRKNLIISKRKVNICEKAFAYNKELINLIVDSNVITIEDNAFNLVSSLQNVILKGDKIRFRETILSESRVSCIIFAYGTITKCVPHSFRGVKGETEILVNSTSQKVYLDNLLDGGDYIVRLVTNTQMEYRIRRVFNQYNINYGLLPSASISTVPNARVEKLPRNAKVEIKIQGHKFSCLSKNHRLLSKTVLLDMLSSNHKFTTVKLNVGYCADCKKYFVYSNVFKNIQDKIERCNWRLVGADFYYSKGNHYGYLLEGVGEFRDESILKICGYTVGRNSKLKPAQRIDILAGIIERKWLSKQGVMSYLNWFIDVHSHIKNHQEAVADWRQDLKILDSMKF